MHEKKKKSIILNFSAYFDGSRSRSSTAVLVQYHVPAVGSYYALSDHSTAVYDVLVLLVDLDLDLHVVQLKRFLLVKVYL